MVVNINAEIGNYKERVVGNYTLRQVICLILALVIGVTTYFYLHIQKDVKQFIVIFTVIPVIAVGFFTYQGVTCEVYMYYVIRGFLFPQKRAFITEDVEVKVSKQDDMGGSKYVEKFSKPDKKRKLKKIQDISNSPRDNTI